RLVALGEGAEGLHAEFRRQLLIGQNRQVDIVAREQGARHPPHVHRSEHDGIYVRRRCRQDAVDFIYQRLYRLLRQAHEGPGGGLARGGAQQIFGRAPQHIGRDHPVAVGTPEADLAAERHAHVFHEQHHVLFTLSPFDYRLENGAQVAHRHVFVDQAAQDFCQLLQGRDLLGLLHQVGVVRLDLGEELPRLLNADELAGPPVQHPNQAFGQNLGRRREGDASLRQGFLMGALDPKGGTVAYERRFLTVRYVEQAEVDRIVVDEQALRRNRAVAHRHALEVDAEAIVPDGLVDLKRDRRNLNAEIVEHFRARLGRQLGEAL